MTIEGMITTVIIKETITVKMIIGGIVVTHMSVITHLAMIKMIDDGTKTRDIRMTDDLTSNGGMMTIDNLIIDLVTNDEMTIDNLKPPGSFNIILVPETNQSHRMFDNRITKKGEASGLTEPICYICRKDGHYANQCPTKDKGKVLVVINLVTIEVQQVTTRSKTKQLEWDIQEEVLKVAKERVEEANDNNVARMMQESAGPSVTSEYSTINRPINTQIQMTKITKFGGPWTIQNFPSRCPHY